MNAVPYPTPPAPQERNWPLLFLCGIGLIAAAAAAPVAIEASHRADFERYYTAASAARRGEDIYALRDDRQFKYLPAFALMLTPLAIFCETALPAGKCEQPPTEAQLLLAASIWYCLAVLAYASTLSLAAGLCPRVKHAHRLWIVLAALAFSARFLWGNLRLGQVNIFAMFFSCLAVALVYRQRPAAAGISAAVAAVLKHMPALLLLWFLLRRQWRAAAAFILMLVGLVFVAPMLAWGPADSWALLRSWFENRQKMVTELPADHAPGQSIPAMVNRFLRCTNAAALREKQPLYINIADWPAPVVKAIAAAAIASALALAAAVLWRSNGRPENVALEAGIILLLMLLVSPESRKAHFVSSAVPAAALTAFFISFHPRWLGACLFLAFALLALTSESIIGRGGFYQYLNAYGVLMWGAILLAVGCSAAIYTQRRVEDTPRPHAKIDIDSPKPVELDT